jgi:sulfonate transport system ATP-binding protein
MVGNRNTACYEGPHGGHDAKRAALDAFTRMQLQELIPGIRADTGVTMVPVKHDIDEALHLCDRILVLRGQPGTLAHELNVPSAPPPEYVV